MIQKNKLRIGNLVADQYGTIFQIEGISEFGLDVTNEVENTYMEYDNFEPIPLTEEWLLKFEFNGWDLGIYTMNLVTNNFCIVFDELKIVAENIKYVHQLQNLFFFLLGEELTYENGTK